MNPTPARGRANRAQRRRRLAYALGFFALTNVLTVIFVMWFQQHPGGVSAMTRAGLSGLGVFGGGAGDRADAAAEHVPQIQRMVRVLSEPSGATVWLRGETMGVTPMTLTLPEGEAAVVRLRMSGYHARALDIGPMQRHVDATLEPVPPPPPVSPPVPADVAAAAAAAADDDDDDDDDDDADADADVAAPGERARRHRSAERRN